MTVSDLDAVGFYEKPLLKFERLIETYLDIAPRGLSSFRRATPLWLKERFYVERVGALQSEDQRPEGVI